MSLLPNKSSRLFRRGGSAYVLVLGIALIITILGMAGLAASRVQMRAVSAGADWEEAGTLAFAATEHALSYMNAVVSTSPSTWRGSYTSRQTVFTQAMGRGTMSWALKDEVDGNLAASYLRPVRIYGIGTVNNTTRVYSVQVIPTGTAMDVLRTAIHAAGNITLGNINAANGPISSNASISRSGTDNAAIEAQSVTGSSSGTVTQTVPAPIKAMPSASIYAQYALTATSIPWSSLGSNIQPLLLSAAYSPYGTPDPNGLYSIVLPNNASVQFKSSRICGTILISATNAQITFVGPILWEPARPDYPILIISATNSTIIFQGSSTWLSESSVKANLDPPGTPYQGSSDSDQLDDYPSQYRGLIHIIGSSNTVQLNANTYIQGTLVTDGTIQTTAQCTAVQNPSIYANPPYCYALGDKLAIVPGSWRWDTLP